jgi:hypothetical protein
MTRDFNKGMQNIKYNELNLPELISFVDGRKISCLYEHNMMERNILKKYNKMINQMIKR